MIRQDDLPLEADGQPVGIGTDNIGRKEEDERCDHAHLQRLCQGDEGAWDEGDGAEHLVELTHKPVAESADDGCRIREDEEELVDNVGCLGSCIAVFRDAFVHLQHFAHVEQCP